MMSPSSSKAKEAAKANADYFNVPFVIFMDTSLVWRVERYDDTLACHREGIIFLPHTKKATVKCYGHDIEGNPKCK